MNRKKTVDKLVDWSEERMQAIAVQLADAQRRIDAANTKLELLQSYAKEYQERLDQALKEGLSGAGSRTYLAFMGQLGRAILSQDSALSEHRRQVGVLRERWMAARKRKLAYETLQVRLETEQQCRALADLQRKMDDYAQRARKTALRIG